MCKSYYFIRQHNYGELFHSLEIYDLPKKFICLCNVDSVNFIVLVVVLFLKYSDERGDQNVDYSPKV